MRFTREKMEPWCKNPETVWNAFDKEEKTEDFVIDTPTKSTEKVVAKDTGDIFKFEADVELQKEPELSV